MGKPFISQNILRSTKELCTVYITVVLEKENSYMLKMNTLDKNDNILPITGEVSLSCVVRGYLLGTTDYVDVDVVNLLISSGDSHAEIDLMNQMVSPTQAWNISSIEVRDINLITDKLYDYQPETNILITETPLKQGYICLDFEYGFKDVYRDWGTVNTWNDVAEFIWVDVIDNNQINLQVTTTDNIYCVYPEKVSSDGRYLYFNVADTLGSDMYTESVLYQDPVIGEEYEYISNYDGTEFAQLIYDFGLIGYLTNTKALGFGMHEATNKKYTCTRCGYVYEGIAAPSVCPVCKGTDFVTT